MTRIGLFSRFAFSNASFPLMKTSKKAANRAAFLKLIYQIYIKLQSV
ncbi:hypothetical protein BAMY6639_11120 [Bacillus amyloliquefaciens UMAF6639]|nr:hypothetical protein BAMY6639_11120 [Bacillus amyloliquefaciens UMAF6639]